MFRKVNIPILGLVQNMSLFACPHCGSKTEVFGSTSGVHQLCADHSLDLLADIPLHAAIGDDASAGRPTVVAEPGGERAEVFLNMARTIGEKIGLSEPGRS
jgi:ATP-binding protein involved in chromosome partitioning